MNSRTLLFALAGLLLLSGGATARDVDETLKVSPGGTVIVEVPRGRVDIEGWDRDEVQVKGILDEDTREFTFRNRGADTVIEVRVKNEHSSWRTDDSDLDVFMPRASALQFRGVALDVYVHDIAGGVKGGTVSGDLNLEKIAKRTDVGSVSGDIFLQSCDGRVHLNSVSGDVNVRDCRGSGDYESVSGSISVRDSRLAEAACETVSGDVTVDLEEFQEFSGASVSGEVDFSGVLKAGGRVELESVSGRVELALGKDTNARFNVETGSGAINNQLTSDKPRESEYSRQKELRFTMGSGDGTVSVGTASGRVILRAR